MCQRAMSYRPVKTFVSSTGKKYTKKEWEEYSSVRVGMTQQDPDAGMCYEVFV